MAKRAGSREKGEKEAKPSKCKGACGIGGKQNQTKPEVKTKLGTWHSLTWQSVSTHLTQQGRDHCHFTDGKNRAKTLDSTEPTNLESCTKVQV